MNISVQTFGEGFCYCRPDTTLERENRDFYVPDGISGLMYVPVLFTRIIKSGKCVGEKFAGRYSEGLGFGMLLYTDDSDTSGKYGIAVSSCHDHTSILPVGMTASDTPFTMDSGTFRIFMDDECLSGFSADRGTLTGMVGKAVSKISETVSLRIGDLVVVELDRMKRLPHDSGRMTGKLGETELFDFNIIV